MKFRRSWKILHLGFLPTLIVSGCSTEVSQTVEAPTVQTARTRTPVVVKQVTVSKVKEPPKKSVHAPTHDETENVVDKIKIIGVTLDQTPPPDNTAQGTWIHITWRNNTGRPIREVKGTLRITDDAGNPISGAPTDIWLYTDSDPIPSGQTYVSHDLVNGYPQFDDARPAHHNLSLEYATESLKPTE